MIHKLSPSDFAYLYEECKLCYCLKVKFGIFQPSMPMPGVFSTMNSIMQGSVVGKNLKSISDSLPDGVVVKQEGFVESKIVPESSVFIKGKYDLLVKNPDGTFSLIDFKISKPLDEKIEKYKTQLFAYKFALENPVNGEPIKISKLALLIFYPESVVFEDGIARLSFPPKWFEINYDEEGFFSFICQIDKLLSGPLPDESQSCKWCQYRHLGEQFPHTNSKEDDEEPF